MKDFLKSDKLKFEVMRYLGDQKWHSYYDIQTTLGINYNSLKKQLNFLETLNLVELTVVYPEESHSGKGSYKVKITENGIKWVSEIEV